MAQASNIQKTLVALFPSLFIIVLAACSGSSEAPLPTSTTATDVSAAAPTLSPTAIPTPTLAPIPTPTPTLAPTARPTPTLAPAATATPTLAPAATATPTLIPTPTPTVGPLHVEFAGSEQQLRSAHGVRELTSAEDGLEIAQLDAGVYGFIPLCDVGLQDRSIVKLRRSTSSISNNPLEIHKMPSGEIRLVAYASERLKPWIEGSDETDSQIFPSFYLAHLFLDIYPELVSMPLDRAEPILNCTDETVIVSIRDIQTLKGAVAVAVAAPTPTPIPATPTPTPVPIITSSGQVDGLISGYGMITGTVSRSDTGENIAGAQIELMSILTVPTPPLRFSGLPYAYFSSNLDIVGDDPKRVVDLVANSVRPNLFTFSDSDGDFTVGLVADGNYVIRVFWFDVPEDLSCSPAPDRVSLAVNPSRWVFLFDGATRTMLSAPKHPMPFTVKEGEQLVVSVNLGC